MSQISEDITKLIARDFKENERQQVINLLKKVHLNDVWGCPGNLDSARRSIIELAEGSVHRVKDLVKSAQVDFRDVVAAATLNSKPKPKLP